MSELEPLTRCPSCDKPVGYSQVHCRTKGCDWNTCTQCQHHYNRYTGNHIRRDLKRT